MPAAIQASMEEHAVTVRDIIRSGKQVPPRITPNEAGDNTVGRERGFCKMLRAMNNTCGWGNSRIQRPESPR
jgi:hypothetical protein